MAREFTENTNSGSNNKNQPTHKIVIETEFGNLTVSLFTKNNAFHAQLAQAFENKDIKHFIVNKMTSAHLSKVTDTLEVDTSTLSLFEQANKPA